jgi:protoporphyrinogen IX oxidase
MEIVTNLLFWLHFIGLGLGAVASFGLPVVGAQMPSATAETRPTLFKVANGLSTLGRAGFGVLIITGPLLAWLKFGGMAGFTGWFWAKMVFVLLLLIIVIYAGINGKRAQGGDMAAAKRQPMLGMAGLVLFVAVIFCAVFAFN